MLAFVLAALLAAPAQADTRGPQLHVGGTLLRADGAVVDATPLTVEPRASDPDGVRSIEIAVDGRPAGRRIDPKDYGNGPHRVTITATDRAGNTTTEQAHIRFTHAEPEPRAMLALRGRPATAHAVANVGDADGDGGEDILAGATLIRSSGDPVRFRGAEIVAVAAGGDVNGDGYRDPLLASRDTVYAVFGGPDLQSLDLRRLGRRGLSIRASATALATRRLGDFAVDGDIDGDGLDDIAFAGRGGVSVVRGRRTGGPTRAYRRLDVQASAVAFPGDIDHDGGAELLMVGGNLATVAFASGARTLVRGAPGDDLTTAGSIGDVDGDSTPDLLLGGRRAAVIFAQPGIDVDLAASFPGFRVEPPPGAGIAQVAGAGDLDGDYAPDAAFGFPDLDTAFVVYSPLDLPAVDLAQLPGDRGLRLPGPPGSGAGQAVDGVDAYGDGEPAAVVGGRHTLAIVPRAAGCQPNRLWTFPLTADRVLPRCRRAHRVVDSPAFNPSPDANQIARFNPEPACGEPSRTCLPTAYRSGNARLHGPGIGLATDAVVDLVDSYGTRLAAIQQAGPGCFAVFDRGLTRVGATCDPTGDPPTAHPADLWVQGRACMATQALEDAHYLVRVLDPEGDPATAYRELQGFVRRDQLAVPAADQPLAEAAYTGCGPRPPKRTPVPFVPTPLDGLPTGERLFGFGDRYVSNASFANCEGDPPPPNLNPACYGPYSNYQVPTLASKDPQLPTGDPRAGADWAALTVSTTGASGAGYPSHPQDGQELEAAGGGFVRAIVPRGRPFTALDGFAYADPNVPCDTRRIARWAYGAAAPRPGERAIYGWTVYRDPQGIRERNGLSPGCP